MCQVGNQKKEQGNIVLFYLPTIKQQDISSSSLQHNLHHHIRYYQAHTHYEQ